jgi:hypothetical protein
MILGEKKSPTNKNNSLQQLVLLLVTTDNILIRRHNRNAIRQRIVLSAVQDILRLFWNAEAHYCVHNSPPPATILNRMNLFHIIQHYF